MAENNVSSAGNRISRALRHAEEGFAAIAATRMFSWAAILLLAAAVTLVTTVSFQRIPAQISVGQIAYRDIKADRNYEITDEEATVSLRDEAMDLVLPVYDFAPGLAGEIVSGIKAAFAAARDLLDDWERQDAARGERQPPQAVQQERREELSRLFARNLGVSVPPPLADGLARGRFSEGIEEMLVAFVRESMSLPLLPVEEPDPSESAGAVMRTVTPDTEIEPKHAVGEQLIEDIASFSDIESARRSIAAPEPLPYGVGRTEAAAAVDLAGLLIRPSLVPNRAETMQRRRAAAEAVKPIQIKFKAGEMIIREGARFDPWHIKVLTGIRMERRRTSYYLEFLGTYLLVVCFLLLPFLLAERFFRRIKVTQVDHALLAVVGLSVLFIMRLSLTLAPAVRDALMLSTDAGVLHYAVPLAAGAMIVRMYLGAEISFVFALVLSVLAGLFVETDVRFVAYSLITSMTAIMAIARVDRRSMIIRAGLLTGAAGAVAVLGIRLVMSVATPEAATVTGTLWSMFFALISGLGCAIYTMIAMPIIESVSGYTSDIKLLELANLNHPLLRELIVRAPGTYHHSHLVGLLAEAAASEIGANSLLVRVGAYYHDIGKLKKPVYFVENARPGENRHEKLSPHMSALIISAHVKEGIDLAEAAKIPKVISDMIPQHHGTRRIGFFYDKAKEKEDPELQKIDPKEFQYPGPKPQTREAAILMLADVTEASVRALKEKSPARIEQTVQKTIHDIFNESQLDECDLTLRDLDAIGRALTRTLMGIYHSRIEYAKETENSRVAPQKPAPEGEAGPGQDQAGD